MTSRLLCSVLGVLLIAAIALGQTPTKKPAKTVTPEEREAFEAVIRDYLLKNPSIIREAIQALRAQEEAAAAERAKKALTAERASLVDDKQSPFLGSANADVTIVEFFDYRCGYCKQIAPTLMKLIEADPKVRIVMKELPILGPESTYAAKAALATRSQGKYSAFHRALMTSRDVSQNGVKSVAKEVGVDPKFLDELESPEIAAELKKNAALAERLEITGTPAFVVGDQLLPGAVSLEALTMLVTAERAKNNQQRR